MQGGVRMASGSFSRGPSVKVTGRAQKLGQLEAVNRDFQSKSWANLQLLGQPCNFRAPVYLVWRITDATYRVV